METPTTIASNATEREFLYEKEIESLYKAARGSRSPERDEAIIMLSYHHGLRVSELLKLRWDNVNFEEATIFIKRAKGSKDGVHPIPGKEMRLLRKLKRLQKGSFLIYSFVNKDAPLHRVGVYDRVSELGSIAQLPIKVHPHMFRHSCGYYLANSGKGLREIQDYLGHKNISNTVIYTQLAPNRFNGFWD